MGRQSRDQAGIMFEGVRATLTVWDRGRVAMRVLWRSVEVRLGKTGGADMAAMFEGTRAVLMA